MFYMLVFYFPAAMGIKAHCIIWKADFLNFPNGGEIEAFSHKYVVFYCPLCCNIFRVL